MNSNSITEYLDRKAMAIWAWLTTCLAYVISIVLPIIGANVEKWLKPLLLSLNAPDFIQSDFTVYGSVFGVCGVLTTAAIKKLIYIDAKSNGLEAERLRSLKKELKTLKIENKKLSNGLEQKDDEYASKLNDELAKFDKNKNEEINSLKEKHQVHMDRIVDDSEREVRRLKECLRLQGIAMDAVTKYKSIEQDFKEYNASSGKRKMNATD